MLTSLQQPSHCINPPHCHAGSCHSPLAFISSALSSPSSSHEHRTTLCYLQFFRITKTSPHSSSEGRKISGTTMRIFLLGGGLMFHVHSTLAG